MDSMLYDVPEVTPSSAMDAQPWYLRNSRLGENGFVRTALPCIAALLLVVWVCLRRMYDSCDLHKIPSPPRWPLLGHLEMVFNWERGQETFLNWVEQHGSYVYIQVLHKRIVLVMDPVGIQQILCKGSSYCARKTPEYTNLDVVSVCCTGMI